MGFSKGAHVWKNQKTHCEFKYLWETSATIKVCCKKVNVVIQVSHKGYLGAEFPDFSLFWFLIFFQSDLFVLLPFGHCSCLSGVKKIPTITAVYLVKVVQKCFIKNIYKVTTKIFNRLKANKNVSSLAWAWKKFSFLSELWF